MVNYWLAKQEPSGPRGYHILDLKKDKTTVWDGIHNNQALKFMRDAKKVTKLCIIIRVLKDRRLG